MHYPDLGSECFWLVEREFLRGITNQKHYQDLDSARHQYGICAIVIQTSFCEGSSDELAKRRLFSQASWEVVILFLWIMKGEGRGNRLALHMAIVSHCTRVYHASPRWSTNVHTCLMQRFVQADMKVSAWYKTMRWRSSCCPNQLDRRYSFMLLTERSQISHLSKKMTESKLSDLCGIEVREYLGLF